MSLSRHRLLTVTAFAAFIAVPGPAGVGLAQDAPARYYNPRFSADGTRVIFESTRDGKYTLYSISSDGAGLRKLTNSRQDDAQPQWSADGSLITFTRSVGGVHRFGSTTLVTRGCRRRTRPVSVSGTAVSGGARVRQPRGVPEQEGRISLALTPPRGAASIAIDPPWSSERSRTMARPRPEPGAASSARTPR